jgi:anti-sigma regulatory factor (Ser/Thr protein kinase)
MREFYRPREPNIMLASTSLNTLAKQVLHLTRARWSDMPQERGVVIETVADLDPDLPHIAAAENEIREALTNLIFNAVDAMPDGGTLTIRTSSSEAERGPHDGGPPVGQVHIEVRDTGRGMDEETRRRCLEPFFTTKGERGTGLGLAMVYGIVQRHSADIEIESAPGQGTTVRITRPVRSGDHRPGHAPRGRAAGGPRGEADVLADPGPHADRLGPADGRRRRHPRSRGPGPQQAAAAQGAQRGADAVQQVVTLSGRLSPSLEHAYRESTPIAAWEAWPASRPPCPGSAGSSRPG